MNSNEWIDMNELKRMNWNEWIDMNICRPHLEKVVRNLQVFAILVWNRALPHLQKVVRTPQFLTIFMRSTTWWRCGRQMKWSSRYSRAHTLSTSLSTSSSKSGPRLLVLYDFYVKSRSRYSLVHILSTSTSKNEKNNQVFAISIWNWALATVSCTFCRPQLQKTKNCFTSSDPHHDMSKQSVT